MEQSKSSYIKLIEERITLSKRNAAFVVSDFLDITSRSTVTHILCILKKRELIERAFSGVYYKVRFSNLLQEYVTADIEELAYALARKCKWNIAPSAVHALNLLGLSTQVPARYAFASSGPDKVYNNLNMKFTMIHVPDNEIVGMSTITIMVIQALKETGEGRVTKKDISILKNKLPDVIKQTIKEEAKVTTEWIYEIIKQVCD